MDYTLAQIDGFQRAAADADAAAQRRSAVFAAYAARAAAMESEGFDAFVKQMEN